MTVTVAAVSRSMRVNSASASPRSETMPGAGSQSSPRARSSATTWSAVRIGPSRRERGDDAGRAREVVGADLAIGDLTPDRPLGPGDQLEDAQRVDQAPCEQRRRRDDARAVGREAFV